MRSEILLALLRLRINLMFYSIIFTLVAFTISWYSLLLLIILPDWYPLLRKFGMYSDPEILEAVGYIASHRTKLLILCSSTPVVLLFLVIFFYTSEPLRQIPARQEDCAGKNIGVEELKELLEIDEEILISVVPSSGLIAKVMGSHKKRVMVISEGICKAVGTVKKLARVIVLHELAHVKNKDVGKHAFAEAVWKAYLVTAVVFLPVYFYLSSSVFSLANILIVSMLAPSIAVFFINGIIKKDRELLADYVVSRVVGPKEVILMLRFLLTPKNMIQKLVDVLTFTATVHERIAYAENPEKLVRPRFLHYFTIACVTVTSSMLVFLMTFNLVIILSFYVLQSHPYEISKAIVPYCGAVLKASMFLIPYSLVHLTRLAFLWTSRSLKASIADILNVFFGLLLGSAFFLSLILFKIVSPTLACMHLIALLTVTLSFLDTVLVELYSTAYSLPLKYRMIAASAFTFFLLISLLVAYLTGARSLWHFVPLLPVYVGLAILNALLCLKLSKCPHCKKKFTSSSSGFLERCDNCGMRFD